MQRGNLSLLAAAVLAAGCSSAKSHLSISARASAPLKGGAAAAAAPAALTVTPGEVKLVIRRLELKGVDASGKEVEAEVGPISVDLTDLSGGTHQLSTTDTTIPQADYTQLEMEIGDIEVLGKVSASGDFDFKTSIVVEQETCGTFKVGTDGKLNFTLNIDVSSWFTDPNDPTKQLDPTDPNNRHAIEENIERSFEVFEDNDENGKDDDCECESGDSGSSGSSSSTSSHSSGSGCSCSSTCTPACLPVGAACKADTDCCTSSTAPVTCDTTRHTCQPVPL